MAAQPVSDFIFSPVKRVLSELTEHIQRILQRKKRRLLKIFYVTVVHVDSMDSQFFGKQLKKKCKLSPDTKGSTKSPRTGKKGKTAHSTELREGEQEEKKGKCKL